RGHVDQALARQHDRARLGPQPLPLARAAQLLAEVAAVPLPHHLGRGLLQALLDRVDHAGEAHRPRSAAVLAGPGDLHALLARAEQDDLALAGRQVLPRLVQRDAELARHGRRDVRRPALVAPSAIAPRFDGAVADRQLGVGDDQVGVDLHAGAETVAVDAHAQRAVERERLWRQLGQPDAAVRAGARFAVGALARLALDGDQDRTAAGLDRGLDRVGEARALAGVDGDPIDHDLDGVLLLLVEGGDVFQALDQPVDAHAHEAGLARVFEHLAELALAVLCLARHQHRLGAGRQGQQLLDDLGRRARRDLAAAQVAALLT